MTLPALLIAAVPFATVQGTPGGTPVGQTRLLRAYPANKDPSGRNRQARRTDGLTRTVSSVARAASTSANATAAELFSASTVAADTASSNADAR
jgi:hypothetical protein